MSVIFRDFQLNASVIAPCIYASAHHRTTTLGAVVSSSVQDELRCLLRQLLDVAGVGSEGTFFRVDAYPDASGLLNVLEVNAHFVDGWGTALNLARAAGYRVALDPTCFPRLWTSEEDVYLPELQLTHDELARYGVQGGGQPPRIIERREALNGANEPVYWYGRFRRFDESPHIRPASGDRLDDKGLLSDLSLLWEGNEVLVPMTYGCEVASWDELPRAVVFKPRRKYDTNSPVQFRSDIGRGREARQAYDEGETVAQEVLTRYLVANRPVQLVIMCAGTEPLTGYLQHADEGTRIINDDSEHGPLIFADE